MEVLSKMSRVEICHNRRDRRSCKICASCVNFSRKQCTFLQNLLRSARFALNKYDFTLKLLKLYTLSSILTEKITQITDVSAFAPFHCEQKQCVKFLAQKSGCVKFLTNITSENEYPNELDDPQVFVGLMSFQMKAWTPQIQK